MEVVLLLGAGAAQRSSSVQTWRAACEKHRFECTIWSDWSERTLDAHPWDCTHVVVLLRPSILKHPRIEAIRRAATGALWVLSAIVPQSQLLDEALDYFLLRPGQESRLLGWCRQRMGGRPSLQSLPRPIGTVNVTERTLAIDGELLPLQPREARLLAMLARYSGTTCPADVACRELFGDADDAKRRLLRQYLYQLRQKLGRHARLLQHVPREGYRCLLDLELVQLV